MHKTLNKQSRRTGYSEAAKQKRASLSQNFIKNEIAIKRIIQKAGISKNDIVLEIGPGSGALTVHIVKVAKRVIAIEKDTVYAEQLQKQFEGNSNVQIRVQDFMRATLPRDSYIVLSNPPFSIFNAIVKKLLFAPLPPEKIIIFAQREAAERLVMKKRAYELGVLTEPWFEYSIIDRLHREDFSPRPNVDVVVLQITKRSTPLSDIVDSNRAEYMSFIEHVFAQQGKHLEAALKNIFTHEQWKRICRSMNIPIKISATQLETKNWVQLFESYERFVSSEKKLRIRK